MFQLRIMLAGHTIANWPCPENVALQKLSKAIDDAAKKLASQGRVSIWIEQGNLLHLVATY